MPKGLPLQLRWTAGFSGSYAPTLLRNMGSSGMRPSIHSSCAVALLNQGTETWFADKKIMAECLDVPPLASRCSSYRTRKSICRLSIAGNRCEISGVQV